MDAQLGLDALLVVDLLDAHEGVVGGALRRGAGDDDLLDQLQLEGAHRVEPVDEVVGIAVRGRVAQRAERIERLDRLLRLVGRVHALGLVDDDDGPRRLHELDGLAARELVALLVDDVALLLFLGAGEVLAEGVDVDDEDLQRVARGELAQPVDLLGVVDEVLERQVVVERAEVLGGDLDVLEHALADGHAGHHDDELLEAVAPRQLEDGAQVDVGLAGARLHLDGEVRAAAGLVGRAVEELPRLQGRGRVGDLDVVAGLDGARVGQQLVVGQQQPVADAQLGPVLPGEQPALVANVDDRVLRRALGLAVEEVGDGRHGIELELLVGVELELHGSRLRGVSLVRPGAWSRDSADCRNPSRTIGVRYRRAGPADSV